MVECVQNEMFPQRLVTSGCLIEQRGSGKTQIFVLRVDDTYRGDGMSWGASKRKDTIVVLCVLLRQEDEEDHGAWWKWKSQSQ